MDAAECRTKDMTMMRENKPRRYSRKIPIRPGYIVALEFSATGGVTYSRETVKSEGDTTEVKVVRQADNAELLKDSKAIIGGAYYVMDRTCVNTPLGYYADEQQLIEVRRDVVEYQKAAKSFNEMAAILNSDRRVTIDLFPLALDTTNEAVMWRLARVIADRLGDVRAALRDGDRKAYEAAADKARNLDRMATGANADAVRLALDVAKQRKGELLEQLRSGADPKTAGSRLDLTVLDAAIGMFTEPAAPTETAGDETAPE